MLPREAQARLKARLWQSIAQSEIDTSGMDKVDLESLIDLLTSEAMIEMDEQLGESWAESKTADLSHAEPDLDVDAEKILWEGRPFLSVSHYYTITDQRIRLSEGMLGRTHQNIELIRIQDVDYKQSFGERLFNLGDIIIRSHDPQTPSFMLRNIQDPEGVYDILRKAVRAARKEGKMTFQEEM
ncbi:MAG: PH domain-containing protein [Candidatus Promineifilaceae bacterium]|nr:PH domain-containing protein [Candidatus Promineifilaceae bacterium]